MTERVNYLKLEDLKKHESCNMTSRSRQFAHVSQANWSVGFRSRLANENGPTKCAMFISFNFL